MGTVGQSFISINDRKVILLRIQWLSRRKPTIRIIDNNNKSIDALLAGEQRRSVCDQSWDQSGRKAVLRSNHPLKDEEVETGPRFKINARTVLKATSCLYHHDCSCPLGILSGLHLPIHFPISSQTTVRVRLVTVFHAFYDSFEEA